MARRSTTGPNDGSNRIRTYRSGFRYFFLVHEFQATILFYGVQYNSITRVTLFKIKKKKKVSEFYVQRVIIIAI